MACRGGPGEQLIAGRALYHSKLVDPQGKWEEDNYHRHHGHLELLRKVERLDYSSFAFPEAMKYKLEVLKELIDGYQLDGLFFDWIRTGDVRDDPQNDKDGVADHGYEKPLIEGFKAKYGLDPLKLPNGDDRWVRFRARPHTEFMRSARKLARAKGGKGLPVSALVHHPWAHRGAKGEIDGSYYLNCFEPETNRRSDLIFAYQLDGEWITNHHGLASAFPLDRVKTTLATIKRGNVAVTRLGAAVNYVNNDGTPASFIGGQQVTRQQVATGLIRVSWPSP